jgi:hypothetical protein
MSSRIQDIVQQLIRDFVGMHAIRCGEVIYKPATKQELQIPPRATLELFQKHCSSRLDFHSKHFDKISCYDIGSSECLLATI